MSVSRIERLLTRSGRDTLEAAVDAVMARTQGRIHIAEEPDDGRGPYDSIVSILAVASAADPLDLIAHLRGILAPDGRLHFLEPIGASGAVARATSAVTAPLTRQTGVVFDRPIPELLRASGFTVVDIQRLRPSTRIPLPGPFAQGTARLRPTY